MGGKAARKRAHFPPEIRREPYAKHQVPSVSASRRERICEATRVHDEAGGGSKGAREREDATTRGEQRDRRVEAGQRRGLAGSFNNNLQAGGLYVWPPWWLVHRRRCSNIGMKDFEVIATRRMPALANACASRSAGANWHTCVCGCARAIR